MGILLAAGLVVYWLAVSVGLYVFVTVGRSVWRY